MEVVIHPEEVCGLQDARQRTYVEFGAGKGYLSSMLADASEARHIVLVDVRSFRMKADRYSFDSSHVVMLCNRKLLPVFPLLFVLCVEI